jgi:hypothetical protein
MKLLSPQPADLLRKKYLHIILPAFIGSVIAYLDRVNIAYAGPYLYGYVKDATGSFLWASVALAGMLAAGGVLMLTLTKKPPQT